MEVILVFMIHITLYGYFAGICSKLGLSLKDGRFWLMEFIALAIGITGIFIGRSLSFGGF